MKSIITTLLMLTLSTQAQAATSTAQALQVIESQIAIATISNLDFGTATQGDTGKTINPGTSEDSENASFLVTGEPNKTFSILLPANDEVKMYLGGNAGATDPNEIISVDDFLDSENGAATLDNNGEFTFFVGASRSDILATQTRGSYSGNFDVTVVY